jgi:ribosome-associated translation inhibitor RaiA
MQYSDDRHHLNVQIESKQHQLSPQERVELENALIPLAAEVQNFPSADLAVHLIHHPHSDTFHVQFRFHLPGQTLFASDQDKVAQLAFEHCVRNLLDEVEAYKKHPDQRAEQIAENQAALENDIVAREGPDDGILGEAVTAGDYQAFRTATSPYEEWLRKRVGRWVQRYPDAEAQVGKGLALGDLVEEVYLNAFEGYPHRPVAVPFHQWLDSLIDPALKALLRHPDQEKEIAGFARTVRDMPKE